MVMELAASLRMNLEDSGQPRRNVQVVLLMTDDGTAFNEEQLKNIWKKRLRMAAATHYAIVYAKIFKERRDT